MKSKEYYRNLYNMDIDLEGENHNCTTCRFFGYLKKDKTNKRYWHCKTNWCKERVSEIYKCDHYFLY